MTAAIEAFQVIDEELVQSVDVKIEPVLLLEDIETGSLRALLRTVLTAIDDEALKKIDWRPAVGKYLVKGKHILIDFMSRNKTISSRNQISDLGNRLLSASQETGVRQIPTYVPLPPNRDCKIVAIVG